MFFVLLITVIVFVQSVALFVSLFGACFNFLVSSHCLVEEAADCSAWRSQVSVGIANRKWHRDVRYVKQQLCCQHPMIGQCFLSSL